jgi:hypothetical protein
MRMNIDAAQREQRGRTGYAGTAISPVVLEWMTRPVRPPPTPDETALNVVVTLESLGRRSQ